jgi:hypothetical protein
MRCCRFRGHKEKTMTNELESGYHETELQPFLVLTTHPGQIQPAFAY